MVSGYWMPSKCTMWSLIMILFPYDDCTVIVPPSCVVWMCLNTLRPRQNGRYFADDIFKCIFLNENAWISLKISLKFVPKVRIDNIPALVQIMTRRRPGAKPLSEPMYICVTRPQWVKPKVTQFLTRPRSLTQQWLNTVVKLQTPSWSAISCMEIS